MNTLHSLPQHMLGDHLSSADSALIQALGLSYLQTAKFQLQHDQRLILAG